MFGVRSDGRAIRSLNGFFKTIPYIMPTRVDATNLIALESDTRAVTQFLHDKAKEGENISYMSVVIAAYLRTLATHPEANRFVVNSRIYRRNHIAVCFVVLKKEDDGTENETVVKLFLDPRDTVFDVSRKVNEAIEKNRATGSNNSMDKLVDTLFSLPALAGFLIRFLKSLDRFGLLPRSVIDASPFHASMFVTNMASIKMPSIFHHIYNFGTTSIFISMGTKEKKEVIRHDGSRIVKQMMPLNVSTDERICSGSAYARVLFSFQKYLQDPTLLEVPPEEVLEDLK